MKIENLLENLALKGGLIVSSASLSEAEITFAQAENRMYVDNDGLGYVWLPKSHKEYPHFGIIQALCRCALSQEHQLIPGRRREPTTATNHQIERLKKAMEGDGYKVESLRLEELLKPRESEMSNAKIVRSEGSPELPDTAEGSRAKK